MVPVKARLIALTKPVVEEIPDLDGLLSYCARVSSPDNQENFETGERLLNYLIRHKHWSPLEMANAVIEVEAPRDISRQLLRHRSFSFQEFSQRYSDQMEFCEREIRAQDKKNRQNSLFDKNLPHLSWSDDVYYLRGLAERLYRWYLNQGVAKECARVLLPEGLTMSKLYVNGTLRSWLHYLDVRDDEGVTQWEHVVLAREIKKILAENLPSIFKVENEL